MLNFVKRKIKSLYFRCLRNDGIRTDFFLYRDRHARLDYYFPLFSFAHLCILVFKYKILNFKPRLKHIKVKYKNQFSISKISKVIDKCDVISFDVFDTLVFRAVEKPSDVFLLAGIKHNDPDFARMRTLAEIESRKEDNHFESNLEDIYKVLYKNNGNKKTILPEDEVAMEKALCYRNEFVHNLYNICLEKKKIIVATSDMYLTAKDIRSILNNCGYEKIEKIFVSNEYQKSKITKELYEVVKTAYPGKKILHIGDNNSSDFKAAKKVKRVKTISYTNINVIGNAARGISRSPVASISSGLINAKLYNGLNRENDQYDYGYAYGGLLTYGYCQLIDNYVSKKDSKILFLARDSKIFNEVYKKHFNHTESEYVYVSREALLKACFPFAKGLFFEAVFASRLSYKKKEKLVDVLDSLNIGFLTEKFNLYDLSINDCVDSSTIGKISNLINGEEKSIEESYSECRKACLSYFENICEGYSNIYLVDLGWRGTIFYLLKELIGRINPDIKCYGFEIGSTIYSSIPVSLIESNQLIPYCFSHEKNTDLQILDKNVMLVESLYMSEDPGTKGYCFKDKKGVPCFGESENTNTTVFSDLQRGMLDFCNDFHNILLNINYPLTIKGRDAYLPVANRLEDKKYMLKVFGPLNAKDICGGKEEPIKKVLKRLGY